MTRSDDDSDSSSNPEIESLVDLEEDRRWMDIEPDDERVSVVSLFDEVKFPDVHSMLQYCKEKYEFDLVHIGKHFGVYVFDSKVQAVAS